MTKIERGLAAAAAVLILAAGPRAAGPEMEFRAPTAAAPAYVIRASFAVENGPVAILGAVLNGREIRPAPVFKDGKPVDPSKPLEPGDYAIALRHAWRPSTAYALGLVRGDGPGKCSPAEWRTSSPGEGGIPAAAEEGFFSSFTVAEDSGIARRGEIVYLTVTAPKSEIAGASLAVFDGSRRLASQVIETRESAPPESQARTHPVTQSRRLAVAVDAAAGETKLLGVFKTAAEPDSAPAFRVTGEGLGKTIAGDRIVLRLHPRSGQIDTLEFPGEGIKLDNRKAGVIHWNPDVFVPGIAWDHSFDWNPPAFFEDAGGGLVYLNARSGPMPRIKDVFLEVKYAVEKGAPYFVSETRLRADRGLGVVAVRNDEMVLYKELFDTLVYRDLDGRLVQRPLREIPGAPFGLAHAAADGLPWVGLLNSKEKFGFFSLRLASSVSALGLGGDFVHRAGTLFYAPSDGEYVYWVRPWLYTWADHATSNHLTWLPQGSVFYEKNAYIALRWDGNTPAALQALWARLSRPLRVH